VSFPCDHAALYNALRGFAMAELPADPVTIGEAAALVGAHRNTGRNRIKAGHYHAHKVVTPQGETDAIERNSLDLDLSQRPDNPSQAQGRHNPPNPSQDRAVVDQGQADQQLAIVQGLLAPCIEELAITKIELGQSREHLVAAGRTIADHERTIDELRAEVELLRESRSVEKAEDETDRFEPQLADDAGVSHPAALRRDEISQGLRCRLMSNRGLRPPGGR
jgi:hypothetical protein